MLQIENKYYIVYPSWLEPLGYGWKDIPAILSDPLRYDTQLAANYPPDRLVKLSYPLELPTFTVIDGPSNGGLIELPVSSLDRWLPGLFFFHNKGVNITIPSQMMGATWKCNVSYLENHTRLDRLLLGKERMNYALPVTPESIDSENKNVYWLFCFRRSDFKVSAHFVNDICRVAAAFSMILQQLATTPNAIPAEFKDKMKDDQDYVWFQLHANGYSFGYQFAVLMYTSLCLCPIAGKDILASHLVTSIEGQPRFCF